MKKLLRLLRIPESVLAFFGGAFISYSINIYTETEASIIQIIVATLFLIASFLLVVWVLLLQKIDEKCQELNSNKKAGKDFSAWKDVLLSSKNKKIRIWLYVIVVGTCICFLAGIVMLLTAKFIP